MIKKLILLAAVWVAVPVVQAADDEPQKACCTTSESKDCESTCCDAIVEQPTFVGGNEALYKWLAFNIRYPEKAAINNVQGVVDVQFVVEKDGSIGDAEVVTGKDEDLDAEALRVIKAMPKWNPATFGGCPVRCRYSLPISFKLG